MEQGSQRVGALAAIPGLLAAAGVDAMRLFRDAGLAPDSLDDPEGHISYRDFARLLGMCVEATGDQAFGLRVGHAVRPENLGPVGQLMTTAPSLGVAIVDLVSNHRRFIRGGQSFLYSCGDAAYFGYAIYLENLPALAQVYDAKIAAACALIRALAGVRPTEIQLGHARPANVAIYHELLGAPVRFECEQSAVVFPAAALKTPVIGAEPSRRQQVEAEVGHYWRVEKAGFADLVTRLLSPRVTWTDVSMATLAELLGMPRRTISRHLADEGTTFRTLQSRARFIAGCEMLASTHLPVTRIALAVGYADNAVFTRAFRRQAGVCPTVWRAAGAALRSGMAETDKQARRIIA